MVQIRISESLREFSEKELWPIRFAAEELRKYLLRMGAPDISLTLSVDPELMAGPGEQSTETVAYDPKLDDRYRVRVRRTGTESADTPDLSGSITGNNPRAVLLGAYRYLSLIGCRFLKPGLENEWTRPAVQSMKMDRSGTFRKAPQWLMRVAPPVFPHVPGQSPCPYDRHEGRLARRQVATARPQTVRRSVSQAARTR